MELYRVKTDFGTQVLLGPSGPSVPVSTTRMGGDETNAGALKAEAADAEIPGIPAQPGYVDEGTSALIAPLELIGSTTRTGEAQNTSDSPHAAAAKHGGMVAQAASIRPMQDTAPGVFLWRVVRQQSEGDAYQTPRSTLRTYR